MSRFGGIKEILWRPRVPVTTKKKKVTANRKPVAQASKKTSRARKGSTRLDSIRRKLEDHRAEILDLYNHDLRAGQAAADDAANDVVDQATNSYNRDFMFSLSDAERIRLLDIEKALSRVDEGLHGLCANCEEKIPQQRLRAVPWARYCIGCQERYESGLLDDS